MWSCVSSGPHHRSRYVTPNSRAEEVDPTSCSENDLFTFLVVLGVKPRACVCQVSDLATEIHPRPHWFTFAVARDETWDLNMPDTVLQYRATSTPAFSLSSISSRFETRSCYID